MPQLKIPKLNDKQKRAVAIVLVVGGFLFVLWLLFREGSRNRRAAEILAPAQRDPYNFNFASPGTAPIFVNRPDSDFQPGNIVIERGDVPPFAFDPFPGDELPKETCGCTTACGCTGSDILLGSTNELIKRLNLNTASQAQAYLDAILSAAPPWLVAQLNNPLGE